MRKLMIVLLISASFSSACVATRKFTRNEVKASADTLNSRIDKTDADVKEANDSINRVDGRVTAVDTRVTGLDDKTTKGMATLNGEVQNVDKKAGGAQTSADHAAAMAEEAGKGVTVLDDKFQNRNLFIVSGEKAITFKFDSAKLDAEQQSLLDEVADMLQKNANAVVVLEGRTDSVGNSDYNIQLGERRSDAVRRYLAVDKMVPVYKIHQISFGSAQPIADNKSREGREKNRAVAITILVPKVDAGATPSQ